MVTRIIQGPTGPASGQSDIDGQSGGKVVEVKQVICDGNSQAILFERPRRYAAIIDAPTELGLPVYVTLGELAGTTNCTRKMNPGDSFILEAEPYWRRCEWTGRVCAITDGLAVVLNVTEIYFA